MPLARTLDEPIPRLRTWAEGRACNASALSEAAPSEAEAGTPVGQPVRNPSWSGPIQWNTPRSARLDPQNGPCISARGCSANFVAQPPGCWFLHRRFSHEPLENSQWEPGSIPGAGSPCGPSARNGWWQRRRPLRGASLSRRCDNSRGCWNTMWTSRPHGPDRSGPDRTGN